MKKQRKPQVYRPYTWINVMMADPVMPMPEEKQLYQLNQMRLGLHAMEQTENPEPEHWRCVADAINLLETMQAMGVIDDSQGLLKDAVFAMGEAGARAMQGKSLRLSGTGIQACRAVLNDFSAVLSQLPERTMIQAYIKTEKRIADIAAGKSRTHDVQVISI